ncbi:MAG: restriction endonuclease subunit S [bacterium]|nr:restriction endonuclease subunit S [bacterium]MDY4098354.1 restriction endonuclease subunit S [Lachnospiraceae bacterium]
MSRQMKDSGIEWIGEIPEAWEVVRMKSCISARDSGAWGVEANGEEGDAICLRIADFDYSKFTFKNVDESELTIRHYNMDIINKLALRKGDIVIEKSGGGEKTPVGRTVIFDKDYVALYANFCDRLRCREIVTSKFLQYIFVTFYTNKFVWNYIKQTTGIQNLDLTTMLAKEMVALPSLAEQERIAKFLDSQCAHIDAVIEKTKASVEEYKKLKQAVITQAVTKGVRGDRPMKDSGSIWFGEIPKDVNISRVGLHYDIILGKMVCSEPKESSMKEYPYICAANVHFEGVDTSDLKKMWFSDTEISTYEVRNGDLLVVEGGAGAGGCAIAHDISEKIGIQNSIQIVRPKKDDSSAYLCYLLQALVKQKYIDVICNKATIPHFTKDKLATVPFIKWSYEEQCEIVAYLDKKCSEMDVLVAKKEAFLTELETYKKSLIYEYVTGKKEVPQSCQ